MKLKALGRFARCRNAYRVSAGFDGTQLTPLLTQLRRQLASITAAEAFITRSNGAIKS